MKYFMQIFICVLIIFNMVESGSAQAEKGDKELSFSSSFISSKYEGFGETWWAANLAMRTGIYITENIEIEPELILSKYKNSDVGVIFSGNLLFNFNRGKTTGRVVPFLLCGAGISNAVMSLPNIASDGSVTDVWPVLNLGCGVKIFMSKSTALRVEYRFQKMFRNISRSNHMVLIGISIFF